MDPVEQALARVHADLAFLCSNATLSYDDAGLIRSKLATVRPRHAVNADVGFGHAMTIRNAQQRRVRVLWDYAPPPGAMDHLFLRANDIVYIENDADSVWWRGSCNGHSGVFPSNCVETVYDAPQSNYHSSPPPPFHVGQGSMAAPYPSPAPFMAPTPSWNKPPSQWSNATLQPAPHSQPDYNAYPYPHEKQPDAYHTPSTSPYPNLSTSSYPNAPPQHSPAVQVPAPSQSAPPTVPAQTTDDAKKPNKFGKLGGTMATHFAGGLGFGAGSAVAHNAINAIF